MIPLPIPTKPLSDHTDDQIWTITVWAEGRGEPDIVKHAIAWVIKNRHVSGMGSTIKAVCLASAMTRKGIRVWQFSCFNPKDPNFPKLRDPTRYEPLSVWQTCSDVVEGVRDNTIPDPTAGARFYYDKSIAKPVWANKMTLALATPKVDFYRA